MKDIPDKSPGDKFFSSECNPIAKELENLVTTSGQTLNEAVNTQCSKASAIYAGSSTFYTDSGVANNYILNPISPLEAVTYYSNGLLVRFIAGNTNTGVSQINIASIGAKPIRKNNGAADLAAGDIQAGHHIILTYVLSGDYFELTITTAQQFNIIDSTVSKNIVIANDPGDLEHDILSTPGICADSTHTQYIRLQSNLIKRIDANWMEGNNQGGFPSGLTLSPNTLYHFFWILKNTGLVDAGWDSSLIATNLLADATNYLWYKRVASMWTDSTSNIYNFINYGNIFLYKTPYPEPAFNNPGTSQVLATLRVPTGFKCRALLHCHIINGSALDSEIYIHDPDINDIDPLADTYARTFFIPQNTDPYPFFYSPHTVGTNINGQIAFRISRSIAGTSIQFGTRGYIDPRI